MRVLDKESIREALKQRFVNDEITTLSQLPSPFELKDMDKGTDRIIRAIQNNEKILLVGDYDVDGTTSRVIIEDFFEYIGVKIYSITPNRFRDGYGLSADLIKGTDAKVIITVDNGITSYHAGEYCAENNIDLIITDHHISSKLPKAYAIINPKQPECSFAFPDICGAQVAWYLIAGLKHKLDVKFDMSSLLDILGLAIIADVMPLVSMNRILVQKALSKLSTSTRPAILVIKEMLGRDIITAEDIGFNIAPKINAAGRMEDAIFAINFLKSKDLAEARVTYEYLDGLNQERKQIQKNMIELACKMYDKENPNNNVIVVASEDFNAGVIGIVASSLADKYKKIALVGSIDTDTNMIKMSGRSYGGVDLFDLLDTSSDSLSSFGGHREAVGLNISLNNIDIFKKQINNTFDKNFIFKDLSNIFSELKFSDIDYQLLEILDDFEPYGHKNERPIFLIRNPEIIKAELIGQDKKTLKLSIQTPQAIVPALLFNNDFDIKELQNANINLHASVNKNNFRGNTTLQLLIQDIDILL